MTRLADRFQQLHSEGRAALIPYVMTGEPEPDGTVALMHGLVRGGADIIELGMPFSDPIADGPVIQAAGERALAAGCRLRDSLAAVRDFRETDAHTPVVLMGYLNPVEIMGVDAFVDTANKAGVDGILLVDAPPEEAGELTRKLAAVGIDMIFLIAPTTTRTRRERAVELASGFLYYVSLKGVTGSGGLDVAAVQAELDSLRDMSELPLAVGFGISDAATAGEVAGFADAVVIGSALVRHLHAAVEAPGTAGEAAEAFLQPIRRAIETAAQTHHSQAKDTVVK